MQALDGILHLLLRRLLEAHVERRRHLVAAAGHRGFVAAQDRGELVAHLEDEVRCLDRGRLRARDGDPFLVSGVGLRLGHRADVHHLTKHVGAAVLRAVKVLGLRRVEDRRLRQSGEERGLGERELREVRLAEIRLGRRLHAVRLVAVVDLVEVELEDLLLRVRARHLDREDALADLPRQGDLATDDPLLHELLRDGRRATLTRAPIRQVREDRARDAEHVDPGVGPEGLVLGGDGRVDEHLRDLVVGDDLTPLLLELVEEPLSGAVVHAGRLCERVFGEVLGTREIGGEVSERGDGAEEAEPDDREKDAKEPGRQHEAPPTDRTAAPVPPASICAAPERVVVRDLGSRDASMVRAPERIL